MAFPLCDEERQEHMIAANDTHEIDIEGPLPFLDWNILGKTATHRRNIVHDDMHCAKTHQRLSLQLLESERSEEHTSELQSLMRISYAVFCLKKKKNTKQNMQQRILPHYIY